MKSNQKHKITKSSARQFSIGRFSATKGFDSSQQTIQNAFDRIQNNVDLSSASASQAADSSVEIVVTDYSESGVIATALTTEEQKHEQNEQVEEEDLEEDIEEFISVSLPEESATSLYLESIQNRLSREDYPSVYARGTFWIEPMMPFFMLKKNKKIEFLHHLQVFLWIPHLLLSEWLAAIHCPCCKSKMETKEFNKQPHARKIVDIDSCFHLMSMRYRCLSPGCGKTINAHDSQVIKQLTYELQFEFPAILTHKGDVFKAVADLLRPCIQNPIGPKRFQKILVELHHLCHDCIELQYLLSVYRKRSG
ncbi:hypothetical protein A0J61_09343, partial [Choanephora cucurbitarum]